MLSATPETLTCSNCGCSSAWREAFTAGKDGTLPKTWCPPCAEKHTGRWSTLSLVMSVAAIFFGAINLANHPHNVVHAFVMGWGVFNLSLVLMVWPHELAHAFAARLVGFRTIAICVGSGPVLFDRTVLAVRVVIRRGLYGGLTYVDIRDVANFNARMIAVYLAGALANLAFGIAALAAVPYLPASYSGSAVGAMVAFGIANLYMAGHALWPRSFSRDSMGLRSDGGLIVDRLKGVPVDFRGHEAGVHLMLANFAYLDRRFADVLREAEMAEALSDDLEIRTQAAAWKAEALSESDQAQAAVELLRPMLERSDLSEWQRVNVAQSFAWAALLTDDPVLIEEALAVIERCRQFVPWSDVYLIKHICLLAAGARANPERAAQARMLLERLEGFRLRGETAAYGALARSLVAVVNGNSRIARTEYESARIQRATAAPLRLLERRLASA